MGDVVNLRQFRKRKSREDAARHAGENRIRHGESKPSRTLRETDCESAVRILDAHRRDKPGGKPDDAD